MTWVETQVKGINHIFQLLIGETVQRSIFDVNTITCTSSIPFKLMYGNVHIFYSYRSPKIFYRAPDNELPGSASVFIFKKCNSQIVYRSRNYMLRKFSRFLTR